MPSNTPLLTTTCVEAHIRSVLRDAGYTVEERDAGHPYGALAVQLEGLPGEVWISGTDGYLLGDVDEHVSTWARYYPDHERTVWQDVYSSECTDPDADARALLATLDALDGEEAYRRSGLIELNSESAEGC
ncbi:hypothetical protein [Streptomyces sp. NPDC001404]|uniref:hypothetical protein n=1 Tax=Streptomyces sp. NPDC001404 TaxID=3364571 RepID=UPI0036817E83